MTLKDVIHYTKELTLLYVEDDAVLRQTTQEMFSNFFDHIEMASDGKEGLEKFIAYAASNEKPFDIVITDINMPYKNGIEMSKEILEHEPMQSIIIVSAHNDSEYLHSAIELGVSAFLTKPFNPQKLAEKMYQTARAISDRKFVEEHVEQMEKLNIQLMEQNEALIKKNEELEKSARIMDTMVEKNMAMYADKVEDTLAKKENWQAQIKQLIHDDLFEMEEILVEIDVLVIDMINAKPLVAMENMPQLLERFEKYASLLSFYTFFHELSHQMLELVHAFKHNPVPRYFETLHNIFVLLESFIFVLSKWHDALSTGDEQKINEFDASLINDIKTIIMMWKEDLHDDHEHELDDIFEF